jgi:hypothetical protein
MLVVVGAARRPSRGPPEASSGSRAVARRKDSRVALDIVLFGGRLLVALLLILGALGKLLSQHPTDGLDSVGTALVLVEVALAGGLLIGMFTVATATLTALLLTCFLVYHVYRTAIRAPHPCRCFGALQHPLLERWPIVRTMLLLLITLALARNGSGGIALDAWLHLGG